MRLINYSYCDKREKRLTHLTAQKMKFSITDFFSKCDQIRSFLQIWSHLLKKSVMENFNFCAVFNATGLFLYPQKHQKISFSWV